MKTNTLFEQCVAKAAPEIKAEVPREDPEAVIRERKSISTL